MEEAPIEDFLDYCYAYGINSEEHRQDFRSAILGYMFAFKEPENEQQDEGIFDGTTATLAKQISDKDLIDQLDAFKLG